MKELIDSKERLLTELEIPEVFGGLPADEMLEKAVSVQKRLPADPTLARSKPEDVKEIVTQADIAIQETILQYMHNSVLQDTFRIRAEEALSDRWARIDAAGSKLWQLIIDPLDGTGPFVSGSSEWGVMVGACDPAGELVYSWNLLSTGEIFDSSESRQESRQSFTEKIARGEPVAIDVFDYNAGAPEKVGDSYNGKADITSYPAASWAAGELWKGHLDGLLWLPSDNGKKTYPDYDLIHLGALESIGLSIRLGKNDQGGVEMVVIAPTDQDADQLTQTGMEVIPDNKSDQITVTSELKITSPITRD